MRDIRQRQRGSAPAYRPLLLAAVIAGGAQGAIRHVDDSAPPGGDGSSWPAAFRFLQDALAVASAGDQIWVAAGTYRPDEYAGNPSGTGDRDETFILQNDVRIYGGFQPFLGVESFDERNPEVYRTYLSGAIGVHPDTSDNSLHVVAADGVNASAVLHGFRIQAGNADAGRGGGMFICNAEPHVVRCVFIRNAAGKGGAVGFGEAGCGGLEPFFVNCQFLSNLATDDGGAVYVNGSRFAEWHNCLFDANSAPNGDGGAILVLCEGLSEASVRLRNCTFSRNVASGGGAMALGPNNTCFIASEVGNSILWNDSPNEILVANEPINPDISFSDVQGGWQGTGNLDQDPMFVDPGNGNFRLQDGSPCLDVGSNAALPADVTDLNEDGDPMEPLPWDLDKTPRIANLTVDMGTYEKTFSQPLEDLNGDDSLDPLDVAVMLEGWGSCPGCNADYNEDGAVDALVYADLLDAWEHDGDPELVSALQSAVLLLGFDDLHHYQSWIQGAADLEVLISAQLLLALFWM